MYLYTIAVERSFAKMPRHNRTPPYTPPRPGQSCTAKRRFRSEFEAQRAAELQMLMQPTLELRVYHCPECGGWHLTRSLS